MRRADDDEINPYQAPRTFWEPLRRAKPLTDPARLVKRFRQECVALGALWIITGVLAAIIGFSGITEARTVSFAVAFGAALCVAVGVLACLKHIWAARLALWFGYCFVVSLAAAVLSSELVVPVAIGVTIMPGMVLFASIAQAHRVIRWSKRLRAAGIPLDARPEEV